MEVAGGAHVLIQGNTFEENRHAIASTFDARNEYYAYGNLVMPNVPRQEFPAWLKVAKDLALVFGFGEDWWQVMFSSVPDSWYTHDFDVHGAGPGGWIDFEDGLVPPHAGAEAGKNFDIAGNTFLGDNRENFDLRGTPCLGAAFYNNVSRRSQDDAVTDRSNGNIIRMWENKFSSRDPTQSLGTGDFDGDGKPDLFMATGAAWYYRPAGTLEWRFLNDSTLTLDRITLQDADGDGRTDAVYQIGNLVFTSWGASSPGDVTFEFPLPPQKPPKEPPVPPHGQRP